MEKKTKGPSSYIYIVECKGPDKFYKIGFASNPHQRVRELQIDCPYPLEIVLEFPGGFSKEQELHKCYKNSMVRGEWFNLSPISVELLKMSAVGEWAPHIEWLFDMALKENPQEAIQSIYNAFSNCVDLTKEVMTKLEPLLEAHDR